MIVTAPLFAGRKWIAFMLRRGSASRIFVAPYDGDVKRENQWVAITDGSFEDLHPNGRPMVGCSIFFGSGRECLSVGPAPGTCVKASYRATGGVATFPHGTPRTEERAPDSAWHDCYSRPDHIRCGQVTVTSGWPNTARNKLVAPTSVSAGMSVSCKTPSEVESQAKLHLPHRIGNSCDDTGAAGTGVNRAVRVCEIRVVERVKRLPSEFQSLPLGEIELLEQRPVGGEQVRAREANHAPRCRICMGQVSYKPPD